MEAYQLEEIFLSINVDDLPSTYPKTVDICLVWQLAMQKILRSKVSSTCISFLCLCLCLSLVSSLVLNLIKNFL